MSRGARLMWLWAEGRRSESFVFLVVLLGIFLALSLLVHSPGMQRVDERITLRAQMFRSGWLDALARGLTYCGNPASLAVVAVVAALVLWRTGRPWAGGLALLTMLGQPINLAMKALSPRTRPEQGAIHVILPAVGFSFPSGHAMVAAMLFGFLAMMAWIHVPDRAWRVTLTIVLAAMPLAIGASRVYLGAHWFSDVIAGWTAGLVFLLLLGGIYKLVGAAELLPR